MPWTLNGVRIFVQEYNAEGSQIIPRLQPLDGETVLQIFGYESQVQTLNAHVIGNTDRNALMNLRKTGNTYSLVSPEGTVGNFYVKKVAWKRIPNICQTLRPDLDEDAPYYVMDIEIYPESDS